MKNMNKSFNLKIFYSTDHFKILHLINASALSISII